MPATGFPGPWKNNDKTTICNFGSWMLGANTAGNPGTAGAAVPATTINTVNQWLLPDGYFECYNTTAATAAMPLMATLANNGINIDTVTGAAAKTIEITEGNAVSQKNAFASRSVPFFVRATFNVNTLANVTTLKVGFRKQQTYNATETSYTDLASFGISGAAGKLQSITQLASGGFTTTDSTNTVTAGTNFTVQVNVDASGNVTYLRDITGNGPLIAPTTVVAYQFGAALTLVPYIYYTTVTSHTEVDLVQYTCGLL
jgi:hypothetical protein